MVLCWLCAGGHLPCVLHPLGVCAPARAAGGHDGEGGPARYWTGLACLADVIELLLAACPECSRHYTSLLTSLECTLAADGAGGSLAANDRRGQGRQPLGVHGGIDGLGEAADSAAGQV